MADETLEPPIRKSIDDPGAHDLGKRNIHRVRRHTLTNLASIESSDSDDHFSDARSDINPGVASPVVPLTRVEKVDDETRYGEEPGTEAYHMRENDAAPDEIAIIPDGTSSPITGPGRLSTDTRSRASSTPGDLPIPITKVEKVDSKPSHGEVPGTTAYELRKEDAQPDIVEEVGDAPGMDVSAPRASERLTESGSPTLPRSSGLSHARRKSSAASRKQAPLPITTEYHEDEDGSEGDFGDDFDDFEEGEEDAEFGDFDDGFQEAVPAPRPQSIPVLPSFVSSNLKHLYHVVKTPHLLLTGHPARLRLRPARLSRRGTSCH